MLLASLAAWVWHSVASVSLFVGLSVLLKDNIKVGRDVVCGRPSVCIDAAVQR